MFDFNGQRLNLAVERANRYLEPRNLRRFWLGYIVVEAHDNPSENQHKKPHLLNQWD